MYGMRKAGPVMATVAAICVSTPMTRITQACLLGGVSVIGSRVVRRRAQGPRVSDRGRRDLVIQ